MTAKLLRIFLFLFTLFVPVAGFAAIYGYVDDQGIYHMTNIRPPQRNYQILIEDSARYVPAVKNLNKNAYDNLIRYHSQVNGLDPHLVKAVMIAESNGNPRAVSHKGAQGLMQIMPDTAQLLKLHDPFDPEENIQAGARYLKLLTELFRGNLELVLAAYNAGPERVMQHKMTIPPISETINYVKRVKLYYGKLKDSQ
jgi:soluble lytic murein transglycosylase-like protein